MLLYKAKVTNVKVHKKKQIWQVLVFKGLMHAKNLRQLGQSPILFVLSGFLKQNKTGKHTKILRYITLKQVITKCNPNQALIRLQHNL